MAAPTITFGAPPPGAMNALPVLAEIRERIAVHGYEAMTNTPQEFAVYIKAEVAKWGKVVKATGIRAD